jgi:hypothetical protein
MLSTERRDRRARRQARLHLESLEDRLALSAGAGGATAGAVVHHPGAHHAHHAHLHRHAHHTRRGEAPGPGSAATPPANVSAALQSLYQEYEGQGGGNHFTPGLPSDRQLQISGTGVAVQLKMAAPGDFNAFLAELQADGLQVSSASPTYGLVEGLLPIAELPAVARVAASVTPAPPPIVR